MRASSSAGPPRAYLLVISRMAFLRSFCAKAEYHLVKRTLPWRFRRSTKWIWTSGERDISCYSKPHER